MLREGWETKSHLFVGCWQMSVGPAPLVSPTVCMIVSSQVQPHCLPQPDNSNPGQENLLTPLQQALDNSSVASKSCGIHWTFILCIFNTPLTPKSHTIFTCPPTPPHSFSSPSASFDSFLQCIVLKHYEFITSWSLILPIPRASEIMLINEGEGVNTVYEYSIYASAASGIHGCWYEYWFQIFCVHKNATKTLFNTVKNRAFSLVERRNELTNGSSFAMAPQPFDRGHWDPSVRLQLAKKGGIHFGDLVNVPAGWSA